MTITQRMNQILEGRGTPAGAIAEKMYKHVLQAQGLAITAMK